MIKIPSKLKKYSVKNSSDLFGNLNYTKNINLDEEGYIKLSSRSVSLFSEKDLGNVRIPTAFGRGSLFSSPEDSVDFAIVQGGQKGYWLSLKETGIALNVDVGTGVATLSEDSHGKWYRNLWHITDDTELYTKASLADTGNYTAKSASLTSGKVHAIEVFKNKDTLCISNGNVVKQFDNTYAGTTNLTLPTDFEVVGLSYSNKRMGVITTLSDTSTGKNQNQEAFFFVWDGASTSAETGIPTASDKIIAIAAYMGSWVILTRTGQLRMFNGGGWDDLTALPFYYQKMLWGVAFTRELLGDVLIVDGSRIYINFNGLLTSNGSKYERVTQNSLGGVWCFDPEVGLYNRYSPSLSPANLLTITSANVNIATNILTKTDGTIPTTGSPIKYIYDKSNLIGGLTTPKIYYVIKLSSTTFQLAETKEKALAGIAIDITSTGASNNYFFALEVLDYGASYASKTGAIALTGTTKAYSDHIFFGSEINDYSTTGNYNHINTTVSDFENRGYFVTPKITSESVEDNYKKVFIKYRPLKEGDKIILKYKEKDIVGLPISTPQARTTAINQCVWTGANAFYTSADFSDAKTAFDNGNELECEIIAGAGAGSLAKITSIDYDAGVYAVTLAEDIDGASSDRYCDVIIDNWKYVGEITSSDQNGWKEFAIAKTSMWFKMKVELRGVETTIEELQIINDTQIASQ